MRPGCPGLLRRTRHGPAAASTAIRQSLQASSARRPSLDADADPKARQVQLSGQVCLRQGSKFGSLRALLYIPAHRSSGLYSHAGQARAWLGAELLPGCRHAPACSTEQVRCCRCGTAPCGGASLPQSGSTLPSAPRSSCRCRRASATSTWTLPAGSGRGQARLPCSAASFGAATSPLRACPRPCWRSTGLTLVPVRASWSASSLTAGAARADAGGVTLFNESSGQAMCQALKVTPSTVSCAPCGRCAQGSARHGAACAWQTLRRWRRVGCRAPAAQPERPWHLWAGWPAHVTRRSALCPQSQRCRRRIPIPSVCARTHRGAARPGSCRAAARRAISTDSACIAWVGCCHGRMSRLELAGGGDYDRSCSASLASLPLQPPARASAGMSGTPLHRLLLALPLPGPGAHWGARGQPRTARGAGRRLHVVGLVSLHHQQRCLQGGGPPRMHIPGPGTWRPSQAGLAGCRLVGLVRQAVPPGQGVRDRRLRGPLLHRRRLRPQLDHPGVEHRGARGPPGQQQRGRCSPHPQRWRLTCTLPACTQRESVAASRLGHQLVQPRGARPGRPCAQAWSQTWPSSPCT